MTSTVLQPSTTTTAASSTAESAAMGWSHDKLRFSCVDNIGLKQLWKLIALDTNANANNKTAPSSTPTATNAATKNSDEKMKSSNSNNNNNEVSTQDEETKCKTKHIILQHGKKNVFVYFGKFKKKINFYKVIFSKIIRLFFLSLSIKKSSKSIIHFTCSL